MSKIIPVYFDDDEEKIMFPKIESEKKRLHISRSAYILQAIAEKLERKDNVNLQRIENPTSKIDGIDDFLDQF